MIRIIHSGSWFFTYPGSWIRDSDPQHCLYIFLVEDLYSDKGIQNTEGGAFEKFKTCRGCYIGLDLSRHVNKVPIHLIRESLYHLWVTCVATLTGESNHRTQLTIWSEIISCWRCSYIRIWCFYASTFVSQFPENFHETKMNDFTDGLPSSLPPCIKDTEILP